MISFSFSVHLFLHRPRTQNSRILGQYTHNLLSLILNLIPLSSSFHPQKYGFKFPKLGPTCQVHLVQFILLIKQHRAPNVSYSVHFRITLTIRSTSFQTTKDCELGAPALISSSHNVCIFILRTVFERNSMAVAPISQLVWLDPSDLFIRLIRTQGKEALIAILVINY